MGVFETAIIYVIIGLVVATALVLQERERHPLLRAVSFGSAVIFWPIFAPLVLSAQRRPPATSTEPSGPETGVELRIRATEESLVAALSKLEGIAEDILAPEIARIRGLAIALRGMAKRLVEMEALLATPEFSLERVAAVLAELDQRGSKLDDPRRQSVESRRKNIERLRAMRARTGDNLERALFEMEEMSSQMMVLKFAGRPEAEVVHMIKDIAASIEGVAEGLFEAA